MQDYKVKLVMHCHLGLILFNKEGVHKNKEERSSKYALCPMVMGEKEGDTLKE